jgi:uncharacterized membrane protein YeaQ/YmgE (transglycosylase-associated protein family)
MIAMKPLFEVIFGLEGFEKVAFWLGMFITLLGSGFFIDYLMHKQGFGVFMNAVYVFVGGFIGLYLRYNYFARQPYYSYEPLPTIVLFFATITLLLLFMSYLRNRTG